MAISENATATIAPARLGGYSLAVLSAALHAGVPVVGKYAQASLDTLTYCLLWVLCAAIYGCAWFTVSGRWRDVAAKTRRHWGALLLMGLCQVGTTWLFFAGVRLLDPTVATFLGQSSALFALILGMAFLRERFTRLEGLGVALAVVGALVISYGGGRTVALGVLAVVASRVFFALFTFIGKVRIGDMDPIILVTGATGSATLIYLVWGGALFLAGVPSFRFAAPAAAYAAIAAGSFFGAFVGVSTFYRAMRTIGFAVGWALRSTQPVFVAVLSFATIGLLPDLQGWIGGLIIIAGVGLITLSGARRTIPSPSGKGCPASVR